MPNVDISRAADTSSHVNGDGCRGGVSGNGMSGRGSVGDDMVKRQAFFESRCGGEERE